MRRTRDFLVGLVFFGLLIVLGIFTIILTGVRFGPTPTTTVSFRNVAGLQDGAEVWIDGMRSGSVVGIDRNRKTGRVLVKIEFSSPPGLHSDATFHVISASALGGKVVSIESGTPSSPPLDLSRTHAGSFAGDAMSVIRDVGNTAQQILAENKTDIRTTISNLARFSSRLEKSDLIETVSTTAKTAQEVLADNRKPIRETMANVAKFSSSLAEDGPQILASLHDSLLAAKGALTDIRTVADGIVDGKGTIGKLATQSALYDQALAALTDIRRVTSKLSPDSGIGKVLLSNEPWSHLESALASVDRAAKNVARASAQLNRRDNVIGLLLTDPRMAKNIQRSVQSLNAFIEAQRENAPFTAFATILLSAF